MLAFVAPSHSMSLLFQISSNYLVEYIVIIVKIRSYIRITLKGKGEG